MISRILRRAAALSLGALGACWTARRDRTTASTSPGGIEKAYRSAERAAVAASAARAALQAWREAASEASEREKQGLVLAAFRADATS